MDTKSIQTTLRMVASQATRAAEILAEKDAQLKQPESGWLIETGSPARWWAGCCWTGDASKVVRFARQYDADTVRSALGLTHAISTSHLWV